MLHRKHHVNKVIKAQDTAWDLAVLAKRLEIVNGTPDSKEKVGVLRTLLADIASISLGVEDISACIEDAIGVDNET